MDTPPPLLNDADRPLYSLDELKAKISPALVDEMRGRFGLVGEFEEINLSLRKCLATYTSSSYQALQSASPPQKKELERLKTAIDRALIAFNAVSVENREEIDYEILYRDPFNSKFFFKEQLDYWKKNEHSTQTAMNKLAQVSHALKAVERRRNDEADNPKRTPNTPLDHLIQDLTLCFERGTGRTARKCNYYDARQDQYVGQYFEFIVFLLDRFAPRSYHSHAALGKRIERALAKMIM